MKNASYTKNYQDGWLIKDFYVNANGQYFSRVSNDFLHVPEPIEGYNWINLNGADSRALVWLKTYTQLDDIWVEAMTQEEIKPRFTRINDHEFFLDLRSINDFISYNAEEILSLRIYVNRCQIITTGLAPIYVLEKMSQDFAGNNIPVNIKDFLIKLITYVNDAIEKTLLDAQEEMDQLEEKVLIAHNKDFREHVINLRLQMIAYKRYVSANIEALNKFLALNPLFSKDDECYQNFAEMIYQMVHFTEEISSIKERAQVIHEELNNNLTERLTTITNKLTVLSSVILPVSCITSLFGVNLSGIPGAGNSNAFWLFSMVLIVVMLVQIILFRLFKWF
jgi:zinc transporter